MAGKNTAVFGIYQDRLDRRESQWTCCKQAGFRNTDISVLFPYNEGTKDFAAEKNTKAPEGTAPAQVPAQWSGERWAGWRELARWRSLDWDRSSLPVRSWPPWLALASAGLLAVLPGPLFGMGIPEYEAKRYEGRIKEGGILLSVHSDSSDWTKKAKEILRTQRSPGCFFDGRSQRRFFQERQAHAPSELISKSQLDQPLRYGGVFFAADSLPKKNRRVFPAVEKRPSGTRLSDSALGCFRVSSLGGLGFGSLPCLAVSFRLGGSSLRFCIDLLGRVPSVSRRFPFLLEGFLQAERPDRFAQ